MNYYLTTITYQDGIQRHHNHLLVKAKDKDEAHRLMHDSAIEKGLGEEMIISIEVHNTLGQEEKQ